MNLMFRPLMRYADFQGRARRGEYWLWFLFQIIASFAFSILHGLIDGGNQMGPAKLIESVFNIAILLPSIAVGVRRFHDIGRTGWWILFPLAVLIVALVVFVSMKSTEMMQIAEAIKSMSENPSGAMSQMAVLQPILLWVGVPYLLASLVTFVFHVTDGTAGNNRFGADPKGRGNSAAAVF